MLADIPPVEPTTSRAMWARTNAGYLPRKMQTTAQSEYGVPPPMDEPVDRTHFHTLDAVGRHAEAQARRAAVRKRYDCSAHCGAHSARVCMPRRAGALRGADEGRRAQAAQIGRARVLWRCDGAAVCELQWRSTLALCGAVRAPGRPARACASCSKACCVHTRFNCTRPALVWRGENDTPPAEARKALTRRCYSSRGVRCCFVR